ncbi:MAG TPA: hypothetical protein VFT59_01440 [Candidatus Saccharimonadales bacterium]|nr:hypothetical protein [Candidatus Saccharimonadales bacterium]
MKNINLSISPEAIKKALYSFMHRFHVVIFVVVALGGLAISVFILNAIIIKSSDTSQLPSQQVSAGFDQETIKKIEELKTRDQSGDTFNLPAGRTNPFVE